MSFYKALERARGGGPKPVPRPTAQAGGSRFVREMQSLAGRLQPLFEERSYVTLMVTGCGQGEGATTVAEELGEYLAHDGRRVLLCGARLAPGTAPPQDGEPPIERIGPNLAVLDMSGLMRDDGHMHRKNEFRERVRGLSGEFDLVLIDSPPILLHASWSILLRHIDGVILVIEAEKTRAAVLRSTLRNIEEVGGHVIGIVFNKRRRYIPGLLYRFL